MKKIFIIIAIVLIVVAIVGFRYMNYKTEYNSILSENAEYEKYKESEIYGIELASLMNKTVDKNMKNKIEKDETGMFIQNDSNSIEIEIYIQDNETTYKMETFYNAGTEQFVQYYGDIKFKCSKVEYHESTKKIKYIMFEQIQTS